MEKLGLDHLSKPTQSLWSKTRVSGENVIKNQLLTFLSEQSIIICKCSVETEYKVLSIDYRRGNLRVNIIKFVNFKS